MCVGAAPCGRPEIVGAGPRACPKIVGAGPRACPKKVIKWDKEAQPAWVGLSKGSCLYVANRFAENMKYDPDIHHRRSVRLRDFDYSNAGYYFATICVNDRSCFFGGITDGEMILNDVGQMIFNIWDEIPKYYGGIDIDEFQIMPNHVHGIVIVGAAPCGRPEIVGAAPCGRPEIVGAAPCGRPEIVGAAPCGRPELRGQARGPAPTGLSLSNVMERFKSLTTKKYIDGVKLNSWSPFNKRLWQRNYYEHVIRNEKDLESIRDYIINNPLKWEMDEYYG